jgi:hypothetical protein
VSGWTVHAVGRATGISKAYTALVRCTYMEGGPNRVRMSLQGGEESKVLEMLCTDCGLGHRYQQGVYSNYKTYVHIGGSSWGLNEPARRGRVQGPNEPMDTACGLWVGKQASAKAYTDPVRHTYMEGGSSRVPNEPAREVLEGQWMACADCGLSNRCQQNMYGICKMYVHGEGSSQGPNEPAGRRS